MISKRLPEPSHDLVETMKLLNSLNRTIKSFLPSDFNIKESLSTDDELYIDENPYIIENLNHNNQIIDSEALKSNVFLLNLFVNCLLKEFTELNSDCMFKISQSFVDKQIVASLRKEISSESLMHKVRLSDLEDNLKRLEKDVYEKVAQRFLAGQFLVNQEKERKYEVLDYKVRILKS